MRNVFLVILASIFLTSCNKIVMKMYGLNPQYSFQEKDALKFKNKHTLNNIFLLDTICYLNFMYKLQEMDEINDKECSGNTSVHDLQQPIQLFCFDKEGKLISYHTNCYTGGFPNLKWNKNKEFDIFPPKTNAPIDLRVDLESIQKCLIFVEDTLNFDNPDYTFIVFCNFLMERQSLRLIKELKKSLSKNLSAKVKVLYVNNDWLFLNFD